MKAIRKWALAVIIIVIIVGVVGATVYLTRRTVTPSFSLAPSTFTAVQDANITFNIYGLESTGIATIYFGDGHEANTTSTLTHAYRDSGRYLIGAEENVNGEPVVSTFNALQIIQVSPQVNASLAPMISMPAISFDVTRNPGAPVVQVGEQVYLEGGYLGPPSGTNITITQYDWDFGNGASKTIAANGTSLNPVENPTIVSYVQSGLYPVTLTLTTENLTSMASYNTSVEQTVAVGSPSQPYTLFVYAGVVPNPTVINIAENGGGPLSLDPHLDFESGWEIFAQTFSFLLIYNGSSTTDFIPMAASEVPSISNGEISADYTSYTFHIRQGLRFSNGDPLTAYDVYYSMIRDILFRGSPGAGDVGTPGWILAQYLVGAGFSSIVANETDTADYNSIVNSMVYSNASDTITFKLIKPFAPELLFSALQVAAILDSSWLERVGAGITFTPAGVYAYQNEGNQGNFNLEVQNNPVSSGPYMIQSYVPSQSISLIPNPGFPGIPGNPGVPKANNTIVIQWIENSQTVYNLFRSGQADMVGGLPRKYFPQVNQLVANGQAKIYESPFASERIISFGAFWWWDPGSYNETAINSYFGTTQYHMPSDYFLNLDVRKAFAYAFNYGYFLDEILGNKKYGFEIGSGYAGVIVRGYDYYVPESELQNVPVYNLTYAKQLLEESGEYGTAINIPFPIDPGGNETEFPMAQMYAAALHSIDPNIVITPTPIRNLSDKFSIFWPIATYFWIADYPYPSDVVDNLYKDPYAPDWLNSTGHPDQAAMYAQMNSLIKEADSTTNATLAAQDYKQIEQIALNLYLYIYVVQPNAFWFMKPYMNGYEGQISLLLNPMGIVPTYVWLVKTCGSTQACSGRGIGP